MLEISVFKFFNSSPVFCIHFFVFLERCRGRIVSASELLYTCLECTVPYADAPDGNDTIASCQRDSELCTIIFSIDEASADMVSEVLSPACVLNIM